jgi:hypothetical protein
MYRTDWRHSNCPQVHPGLPQAFPVRITCQWCQWPILGSYSGNPKRGSTPRPTDRPSVLTGLWHLTVQQIISFSPQFVCTVYVPWVDHNLFVQCMFRGLITICLYSVCSVDWSQFVCTLYVPWVDHNLFVQYMFRGLITICLYSICSVGWSQLTNFVSLYNILRLLCLMERDCVLCEVRNECSLF